MTQAEAIAYIAELLAYDLDNSVGESPTEAQSVVQINDAIRFVAERCPLFDPTITFTLTASTAEYDLLSDSIVDKKVLKPYYIVIGTRTLTTPDGRRGFWTMQELETKYPTWRTDAAGTVKRAVYVSPNKLILHPKPDASDEALTTYLAGEYIPDDVTTSDDSNQLPLPVTLHKAVCWIAAHEAAIPNASEEGWQRLNTYYQKAMEDIDEARRRYYSSHIRGRLRRNARTLYT